VSELKTMHPLSANIDYITINDIHDSLSNVLQQLDELENADIESIDKMAKTIIYLNDTYLPSHKLP